MVELADAVFVAQQVGDFPVEDLPGELARLGQDLPAVLGIGVIAEIGGLVEEALAPGVQYDAEGIAVLLEGIADGEVAELRRVAVPADGVTAGPVASRRGSDVEGHAQAVAGVEAGAAHLREIPAGAEIARAPFGVGLEAAAGQHHGASPHGHPSRRPTAVQAHDGPFDTIVAAKELFRPRTIEHLDAGARRRTRQRLDQPRPAAPDLDRQAAPELEAAVHLEGLAAVARLEAHALVPHPAESRAALLHQKLDQIGIAAVLGDPPHVVVVLLGAVTAEVGAGDLCFAQFRHELAQVIDPVEGDPHGACRETAVAACLVFRRPLQDQHRGTAFPGREGGTEGGVAAADH
jgi:hypothetical protein